MEPHTVFDPDNRVVLIKEALVLHRGGVVRALLPFLRQVIPKGERGILEVYYANIHFRGICRHTLK